MLDKVVIKNFKKFELEEFELSESIILAGPNNSGKTTLLQAIAVWNLGFQKWIQKRGSKKNYTPTKVPITRQEFTALPLREMNLMWFQRETGLKAPKVGYPKLIEIELSGKDWENNKWNFGMEFRYAGSEMIYAGPSEEKDNISKFYPSAQNLIIAHIPCFSGIETGEPRMDIGLQNLLIGKGRPGETLHNLLWEIYKKEKDNAWEKLVKDIEDIFNYRLLPPNYSEGQPFIICEYLPGIPEKGRGGLPKLDIANAGTGMHQVLLLLSFFYARPAGIFLLDEPDAHLHFILQQEILDRVRLIAKRQNCQLIIATHSEALLGATNPDQIISFIGKKPSRLSYSIQREQLREALKKVSSVDLLRANQLRCVLYVESESDYKILREWAKILNHPAIEFLKLPFVHALGGRSLKEAQAHLFALQSAYPDVSGLCILDGDDRGEVEEEVTKRGLRVLRWRRYEIENYLLIPDAIKRYIGLDIFNDIIDKEFAKQLPKGIDYFGDHAFLSRTKASEEIFPQLLANCGRPTSKNELFLIAAEMRPDEIHKEVIEKLDAIARLFLKNKK